MGSISNISGSITRESIPGHITDPLGGTITTSGTGNFNYLLQEDGFFLLQENGSGIALEQ